MSAALPAGLEEAVAWHDVECSAYTADLPVWRELAAERAGPGPLLDIGCGSGRVALDLAARGAEVTGLDSDPALVRALTARARERGLRVRAVVGDARSFDLGRRFALALAPMQVVQLMGGPAGRARMLARVRAHLGPGGALAAALADPFEDVPADDALPPLPDVLELRGWVLSSTPVAVRAEDGATEIDRLRQAAGPDGSLTESVDTVRLDRLEPAQLEREAASAGFRALERRRVPETDGYVGSTVVILEAA
ncbi:MAG: class I SAM-dependent methyltransferase [Thermoleophilaceae bacterium]|nr:class I SAM-dependent methyltransferase [Thermoleophilaceae bacterium]